MELHTIAGLTACLHIFLSFFFGNLVKLRKVYLNVEFSQDNYQLINLIALRCSQDNQMTHIQNIKHIQEGNDSYLNTSDQR